MGFFGFFKRSPLRIDLPVKQNSLTLPHYDISSAKALRLQYDMRRLNTDLVEASYIRCCCAECAKYRERVYSCSGKDRRFPKLPVFLLDDAHDCGIFLFPFVDGASSMTLRTRKSIRGKKIIKYSNRPFVDDRTQGELDDICEIERQKAVEITREQARIDYEWLQASLPSLCPKSFSAYMRMKNANTEKYQQIITGSKRLRHTIT